LSRANIAVFDLPYEAVPQNGDGEVAGFQSMTIEEAIESLKYELHRWKPNSALVMLDFCMRHGFISPEEPDYFRISRLLRAWDTEGLESRSSEIL
jgi:hypothetical protein